MITEDKTFRCLVEWKAKVEKRNAFLAPLALFGSLLLTFVTATFRDALGFSKETWQAVFMIGVAASAIWLVQTLWTTYSNRGSQTVEELLDQLKKGATVQRDLSTSRSLQIDP